MANQSYPQVLTPYTLLSRSDKKMLKKARKHEFWYAAISNLGGYFYLKAVSTELPRRKERPADYIYYCFSEETENWQKVVN